MAAGQAQTQGLTVHASHVRAALCQHGNTVARQGVNVAFGFRPQAPLRKVNVRMAHLKVFLWIAGVIVLVELGLEIRANQRGWDTMIFGFPDATPSGSTQGTDKIEFGPTPTFPFRSRIIPKERELSQQDSFSNSRVESKASNNSLSD